MWLLFWGSETVATLENYSYKSFIKLTPELHQVNQTYDNCKSLQQYIHRFKLHDTTCAAHLSQ